MICLHIVNLQRIKSIQLKLCFSNEVSTRGTFVGTGRGGIITLLWGKLLSTRVFAKGKETKTHHLWRAEGIRSLMRLNWYMKGCGCQVIISQQNDIALKVTSATYYHGSTRQLSQFMRKDALTNLRVIAGPSSSINRAQEDRVQQLLSIVSPSLIVELNMYCNQSLIMQW